MSLARRAVLLLAFGALHCGEPKVREVVRIVSLPPRDSADAGMVAHSLQREPLVVRSVDRLTLDDQGKGWLFADGRLFLTIDAAKTFEDRTPPGWRPASESFFGVSRTTVWIAADDGSGLTVSFSRDEGLHFTTRTVPDAPRPVGVTLVDDGSTLALIARPEAPPSAAWDGTITYRSTNDGADWTIVERARNMSGAVEFGAERLWFASSTPRKNVGVSTALKVSTVASPAWKDVPLAKDDIVSFVPRFSASGGVGVLCTDTDKEVRLARTTDSGGHWSVVVRDPDIGACEELLPTSRGACFALRAARKPGAHLCTRDWGEHWEKVEAFEATDVLAWTEEKEGLVAWGFSSGEILRKSPGGSLERWAPRKR